MEKNRLDNGLFYFIINFIKDTNGVELNPSQVQSAVSYLGNQQKIEIIGRAVYRLKQ